MSWKPKFSWKSALFSLASLATLALAAGARYKPH
jgi:anti-sigma-K factor RskA